MKSLKSLRAIDLFSGAGGLSEGLISAGFAVIGSVEIDKASAATYKMNHPNTFVFQKDIRFITGKEILSRLSLAPYELDLLTGCPPCQGFSTLKTRNKGFSIFDTRNDLAFQFLRLVRSIKPKAVILENVPGFSFDSRFLKITLDLKRSGYNFEYFILNAIHFGIPQRRKRLVLLAVRKPWSIPFGWAHPKTEKMVSVRETIGQLPEAGNSGDPLHDHLEKRSSNVMSRIRAVPKDGGNRTELPKKLKLECHKKSNGYSDVYGRMAWDKPAPTITSGCTNPSKGRFIHPEADRAITLREAALLQTFPMNYKFDMGYGKESVAKQIGNAFPPQLIEPIASSLAEGLLE